MGSHQESKLTRSEQLPGPHMWLHFHGPIYQCDLFLDQFPANFDHKISLKIFSKNQRQENSICDVCRHMILLFFCDYQMDAHTYIVVPFSRKQFFKFDAKFKLICDNTNCFIGLRMGVACSGLCIPGAILINCFIRPVESQKWI